MRKKYLEPRIIVQAFDEETLTSEWEDDADVVSTNYQGDSDITDGDLL